MENKTNKGYTYILSTIIRNILCIELQIEYKTKTVENKKLMQNNLLM